MDGKKVAHMNPSGEGMVLTKIQRYQFIDRMLNESFPMGFLLVLALLSFFTGAVLIGLQILCIIYRTPLFYIVVGIWYGVFLIFSESIVVMLIFFRSPTLFLISIVFHTTTIGLALAATIIEGVEILVSFYIFNKTNYIWLNYSIVGMGIFSMIAPSFYLLIFKRTFSRYHQVFSIQNFYNKN